MFTSPASGLDTGHHRTAAVLYNGIGAIFPLPAGEKFPPPSGRTGHAGTDATAGDLADWDRNLPSGNIGVRLRADVVSIDVDHYGDKVGGDTIAELESTLGPLPATWISTRRDPAVTGQHLYRYSGGPLATSPGPDIDIVQRTHRYMVAAPSVVDGATYQWYAPDGTPADRPPRHEELPMLPPAWEEHLRAGATARSTNPPAAPKDIGDLVAAMSHDDRPMSIAVKRALEEAAAEWEAVSRGSHHDTMCALTTRITGVCARGHAGYGEAIDRLWDMWSSYTTVRDAEMQAMVDSAAALVARDMDEPYEPATLPTPEEKRATRAEVLNALPLDEKGRVLKTTDVLDQIFDKDPDLSRLGLSTMGSRTTWRSTPYWRENTGAARLLPAYEDIDDSYVTATVLSYWGGAVGAVPEAAIQAALSRAVGRRRFSPWRDYIMGLPEWDETSRISRPIPEDCVEGGYALYSETAFSNFFLGIVARALDPGCQHDTIFVLAGPEGTYKTSWLRAIPPTDLPPSEPDVVPDQSRHKDALEAAHAAPIVIFDELDKINRKNDLAALKAFITTRADSWRASYGRVGKTQPRQFVLAGTTNELQFLRDLHGNRRYHPITITAEIPAEYRTREWMDACLAEARDRYLAGERPVYGGDFEKAAAIERSSHVDDPIGDAVRDWLDEGGPDNAQVINVRRILTGIGHAFIDRSRADGRAMVKAIVAAMDAHPGWERTGLRRCGQWGQDRAGTWDRVPHPSHPVSAMVGIDPEAARRETQRLETVAHHLGMTPTQPPGDPAPPRPAPQLHQPRLHYPGTTPTPSPADLPRQWATPPQEPWTQHPWGEQQPPQEPPQQPEP